MPSIGSTLDGTGWQPGFRRLIDEPISWAYPPLKAGSIEALQLSPGGSLYAAVNQKEVEEKYLKVGIVPGKNSCFFCGLKFFEA
ncbi:hypothetical protein GCM10023185_37390 [Hymenobacter saemangeumensis]|uniref:Uncharacterized protein n=2 Tax=Hymenobacter saemangeumensis TaxID=1084522 RepID=A0ABP8IQ61_9BACT